MALNKPATVTGLLCVGLTLQASIVRSDNDPNATTVQLRESCQELSGGPVMHNCFDSTSALKGWLYDPARAADSTVVLVGPGQFDSLDCNQGKKISYQGAGPEITKIGFISTSECGILHVQDMTIEPASFPFTAIFWSHGGESSWTNVRVNGSTYGWTEACGTHARPKHYWFSSKIGASGRGTTGAKTAYIADCSENWFFGTEISVSGNGNMHNGLRGLVARAHPGSGFSPEIHVYGSVIRVLPSPGVDFPPVAPNGSGSSGEGVGLIGVVAGANADVHIHGTGIDVIGNDRPNEVAALLAHSGGHIHANAASYVLETGAGGQRTRIKNVNGGVHAPYHWDTFNHHLLATLESANNGDTVIEDVCSDGVCEPHMMIYSASCQGNAGGAWFDTVTRACRAAP